MSFNGICEKSHKYNKRNKIVSDMTYEKNGVGPVESGVEAADFADSSELVQLKILPFIFQRIQRLSMQARI